MIVSVIVPAYNASSTIDGCLKALTGQANGGHIPEIIVVDDGSSDETADRAAAFDGVHVVRERHRGPAAARNRGAQVASGDILLFTDADCEPSESWMIEMLRPFQDPQVAGVKGIYATRQRDLVPRFVQLEYEDKYARMRRAAMIDFVDTYSAAYRRALFLECGGFDESYPTASVEDQEFSFRLAEKGHCLVFAPAAVVYHRHPGSVLAYVRRKFKIGYWKVRVHRRHPDKVWRDSHTPPALKLQAALFPVAAASLVAIPFVPAATWVLGIVISAMLLSALPLLWFLIRRDPVVALVAPGMLLIRAAALASGLVVGIAAEISRSEALKRSLDVMGAFAGLVFFAPLMLVIAVAIALDSPGPIFFTQWRSGKGGRPFKIFKFRSMVDGAEALLETVIEQSCLPPPVYKIPNDRRVTRVGRLLRRFSLDELPQFLNVLRGEMSLVGPRPEELRIVDLYPDRYRKRLAIKPGLTGPMQIDGRGTLSLDERLEMELDYAEHHSLGRDLLYLFKTIPAVIRGHGAF